MPNQNTGFHLRHTAAASRYMQAGRTPRGLSPNTSGMTLEISLSPSTFHFEKPPIIGELMA